MKLQVIGTKKCKETMKVVRFLKERRVDFQFVDLNQRKLSPGELDNIAERLGPEMMINKNSKQYKERGLEYMVFDPLKELAEDPRLLRTPVIRTEKRVLVGFDAESLESLIGGQDA